MAVDQYKRFEHLTFESFKSMAADESLSQYEKIGFPNSYREGFEEHIFQDICTKMTNFLGTDKVILDIGPGCSELASMIVNHCEQHHHQLILIDSEEVLAHLPDHSFITKIPARFPEECRDFLQQHQAKIDSIICYSVFHYIFSESNMYSFMDDALSLLSHEGEMLIGDIPNVSKRKRFFGSPKGIACHQAFTGSDEMPSVQHHVIEKDKIDDAVLFSIVQRSRGAGFEAYVVPQADNLPMENRREDILVKRP